MIYHQQVPPRMERLKNLFHYEREKREHFTELLKQHLFNCYVKHRRKHHLEEWPKSIVNIWKCQKNFGDIQQRLTIFCQHFHNILTNFMLCWKLCILNKTNKCWDKLCVQNRPDFLDVIASPSTVSQWVIVSDFGDSYRIYRACFLSLELWG